MTHIPITQKIHLYELWQEYSEMANEEKYTELDFNKQHAQHPANPRGASDTYTADFSVDHETDKAMYLRPHDFHKQQQLEKPQWVPRSQIIELDPTDEVDIGNCPIFSVTMTQWIAKQKGWF